MSAENVVLTKEELKAMIDQSVKAALNHKEAPDKAGIEKYLKALPDQTERDFEKKVVRYSTNWADEIFYYEEEVDKVKIIKKGILFDFIDLIKKKAPTDAERKIAFCAFCVAENHERRHENLTNLNELENTYGPYFKDQPFLLHLTLCKQIKELEAYKRKNWNAEKLRKIIEDARINMVNLRGDVCTEKEPNAGNVGAAHILAEIILLAFENAPDLVDQIAMDKADLLEEALEVIEIVHRKDPNYAKFYCTHGRLLAVAGRFEDALYNLSIAIDKEDSTKADYPIRVGRYVSYVNQIRAQRQADENRKLADKQLDDAVTTLNEQASKIADQNNNQLEVLSNTIEEKNKESTTKSMEFLGLFSGIVSFTIGTISISSEIEKFTAQHVAGLIVVLMGALLAVFAGFGIILHGMDMRKATGRKGLRNLFVLLLGIGIVVGGYFLCLG